MPDPTNVGINLILTAPDVNPQLNTTIDTWDKLIASELEAKKTVDDYANAVIDQMKQVQKSNEDTKKSVEAITDAHKEQADQVEKTGETKKRGVFQAIKDYFQERQELKAVTAEIKSVQKELENLDLKQRAIGLSARRGNREAIAEYNANDKQIGKLQDTLAGLNEKFDASSAKVELSSRKFAGLKKVLDVAKAAAVLTVTAIIAIGAAVGGVLIGIGKSNDQVKNQFDKVGKDFEKFKDKLSTAVAPIAFTIGKIIDDIAIKLTKFIDDNQESIFQWSVGVAGRVAGTVAFIGAAFDKMVVFFKKAGLDFRIVGEDIAFVTNILAGNVAKAAVNSATSDILRKQYDALAASTENLISPTDAYNKALDETTTSLNKLGLEFFKHKNLTQDQIDALKKLQEEYKKLTKDINDQIQALDLKEAGPIAGVLLKAELNAKLIEEQGKHFVEVARALGKSKEEIAQIEEKVLRLANAIRSDASNMLLAELNALRDENRKAFQDQLAKLGGFEDEIKFDNQLKELDNRRKKELEIAVALGKTAEEIANINREIDNQVRLLTEEFFADRKVKEFKNRVKSLEDAVSDAKKLKATLEEQLATSVSLVNRDPAIEKGIQVKIDVVDDELLALETKLKQTQDAGPFKLFIDVSAQTVNGENAVDNAIKGIKPGEVKKPKIKFSQIGEATDLALGKLKGKLDDILGDGWEQKLGSAFNFVRDTVVNSINDQIAAIDRLIAKREDSVKKLEDQTLFEANLKALGVANEFAITKKKLDDEIKLRDEAAKQKTELEAKQLKLQKTQDTISQTSSLITASANIWKVFSSIPIVGPFLALAAIAGMFAAFINAKAQAAKVASAYKGSRRVGETFGTIAPGESPDEPGRGPGLKIIDSRGNERGRVGGDEFLHKATVLRKHNKGLWYLNENEQKFSNLDLYAFLKASEKSGGSQLEKQRAVEPVTIDFVNYKRISEKNNKHRDKIMIFNQGIKKDEMRDAVKDAVEGALKTHLDGIISYLEERPTVYDDDIKNLVRETAKTKKTKKQL